MFFYIKRRNITLLEVVISLTLLTLLMGTLFSVYRMVSASETALEKRQEAGFLNRYLAVRLEAVIGHAAPFESKDKIFFTDRAPIVQGESLVLLYESGCDLDPLFSSYALGRLFVDEKGRLVLASWPNPYLKDSPKEPMRQEILLEGVKEMRLFFWVPKEPGKMVETESVGVGGTDKPLGGQWIQGWQKSWKSLPLLVKVEIERETGPLVFHIFVPHSDKAIDLTQLDGGS